MEKNRVEIKSITYKVTTPDELIERFEDEAIQWVKDNANTCNPYRSYK